MDRRRWCRRAAWGGGTATVAGIVLFALFSDAGGSCTANVIVLSDGVIGPHGCAASSIAYHAGIGLMVLGAALVIGACVLSVVGRTEQSVVGATGTAAEEPTSAAGPQPAPVAEAPAPPAQASPAEPRQVPQEAEQEIRAQEEQEEEGGRAEEAAVALPPGWYGNPSNANGAVQWWDGHRLVDRPPPAGP